MAPQTTGFAASTPVGVSRVSGAPVVDPQRAVRTSRAAAAPQRGARMMADGGLEEKRKDEPLGTWLLNKIMHNHQDFYGYEPFFKEGMTKRDEEKKKAYDEMEKSD